MYECMLNIHFKQANYTCGDIKICLIINVFEKFFYQVHVKSEKSQVYLCKICKIV